MLNRNEFFSLKKFKFPLESSKNQTSWKLAMTLNIIKELFWFSLQRSAIVISSYVWLPSPEFSPLFELSSISQSSERSLPFCTRSYFSSLSFRFSQFNHFSFQLLPITSTSSGWKSTVSAWNQLSKNSFGFNMVTNQLFILCKSKVPGIEVRFLKV